MPIVEGMDRILSLRATKRHGYPGEFGLINFGYALFGAGNPWAAIYQDRMTLKGKKTLKMVQYWPTISYSAPLLVRRGVFADAVLAWQSLTLGQQKDYNERAKRFKLSGYNLFLREWLKSH